MNIKSNMGKSTQKMRNSKDNEPDHFDEIDELYRPFLIHSTTYVILTDQILSLMPSERNVLLTMNEYSLNDINPMHQCNDESPTHVIIFCIRFIAGDIFQPIGGLLIYKQEDQSALLAECLKAYINDLWKLGLYVIATVSPAFETFKGMLHHLVDINVNTYCDAITYSVAPFKEIVHVYDFQFLLIKLQNLFKEGDIKFIEGTREYRARWSDVSLVLNLCSEFKILSNYLLDNKDVSRRVHIFTQQIFEQVLELDAQGVLSEDAGGIAVLLNCVRTFIKFTELDLVDLNLMQETDCWDSLAHILQTMTFQKSKKRTCTKVKPSQNYTVSTLTKRKLDFQVNADTDVLPHTYNQKELVDEQDHSERQLNDVTMLKGKKTENNCGYKNIHENYPCNNSKPKKGKKKKEVSTDVVKNDIVNQTSSETAIKCSLKLQKPPQKSKELSYTQTLNSVLKVKTDSENKLSQHIKSEGKLEENLIEIKPCYKTDTFLNVVNKNTKQDNYDNKDFNCDNNNNGSENILNLNQNSTTLKDTCDNKHKAKKQRKNKKIKEESFDIVINDAQKFFECFSQCAIKTGYDNPLGTTKAQVFSNNIQNDTSHGNKKIFNSKAQQPTSEKFNVDTDENTSKYQHLFLYDGKQQIEDLSEFWSQSDEETEKCITKNCDNVPNIVELLDHFEINLSDDFEPNNVSYEMLCTVFGMKKIINNLIKRRVKVAKPDAFVVEHIDFLVTLIKRDRNNMNPVYYYGHNYEFLNSELAFATLQNKNGLYLVSK